VGEKKEKTAHAINLKQYHLTLTPKLFEPHRKTTCTALAFIDYWDLFLPVLLRRNADYPMEVLPKKRLRREIQFIADLLNRHVGGLEKGFGF
jgi:hypothetical protein